MKPKKFRFTVEIEPIERWKKQFRTADEFRSHLLNDEHFMNCGYVKKVKVR
jgi:hypothetical protein